MSKIDVIDFDIVRLRNVTFKSKFSMVRHIDRKKIFVQHDSKPTTPQLK